METTFSLFPGMGKWRRIMAVCATCLMLAGCGSIKGDQDTATVMAERQAAAKSLQEINRGVSIFGSARLPADSPYYALTEALGAKLARAGFDVITGGGGGIMEAANKGAFEAGGHSVGFNVKLPRETTRNKYQTHSLRFENFDSRKAAFFMHSKAYVVLPGGFGTQDELFEVLTLMQNGKIPSAPIVLIGVSFWSGLLDWAKSNLLENRLIGPNDLDLIVLTDDVDVAVDTIKRGRLASTH